MAKKIKATTKIQMSPEEEDRIAKSIENVMESEIEIQSETRTINLPVAVTETGEDMMQAMTFQMIHHSKTIDDVVTTMVTGEIVPRDKAHEGRGQTLNH